MKSEHLSEIIAHQTKFMKEISTALENELKSGTHIVEQMQEKIMAGLKWGLFLRDDLSTSLEALLSTKKKWSTEKNQRSDWYDLIQINFDEIFLVQKAITKDSSIIDAPVFSFLIADKLKSRQLSIEFEYEDLNTKNIETISQTKATVDDILDIFQLRLTLPDFDAIFDYLDSIPNWMFEHITPYEEWSWSMRDRMGDRAYIQIGGNGQWIQGSFPESYIGQVNNDVGDAGSVFISLDENNKFTSWVDMH